MYAALNSDPDVIIKLDISNAFNHAASGWRIQCGVEVTELSTNKQHTLSLCRQLTLEVLSIL